MKKQKVKVKNRENKETNNPKTQKNTILQRFLKCLLKWPLFMVGEGSL